MTSNDTGATQRSTFTVQVDNVPAIHVTTNSSGVFTNLSLAKKHLVKIQLDGKPLTSFRFSFENRPDHLVLWYNEFYGTWSLSDIRPGQKCACPEPQPPHRSANAAPIFFNDVQKSAINKRKS